MRPEEPTASLVSGDTYVYSGGLSASFGPIHSPSVYLHSCYLFPHTNTDLISTRKPPSFRKDSVRAISEVTPLRKTKSTDEVSKVKVKRT